MHSAKDLLAAFESVEMEKTKKQSSTKPFGKFAKFMCWKKPSTKNTIIEDDEEIIFTRLPSEASLVLESPKRRTSDASLKIAAAFFQVDRPSLPPSADMAEEDDFTISSVQSPISVAVPTLQVEEKNATPPPAVVSLPPADDAAAAAVLWPAGWTRPFTAPIRPEELENAYMAPGCKVTASEFAAGQFIITVGNDKVDEIIFLHAVPGPPTANTVIPATLDDNVPAIIGVAEDMVISEVNDDAKIEPEVEDMPQAAMKSSKRGNRFALSFGKAASFKAAVFHRADIKLTKVEADTPEVFLPLAVLAIKAKSTLSVTARWTGFAASCREAANNLKAAVNEAAYTDEIFSEVNILLTDTKEILKLCVEVLGLSSLMKKTPMARPSETHTRSTACTLALTPASMCVAKALLQLEYFPELSGLSTHGDDSK